MLKYLKPFALGIGGLSALGVVIGLVLPRSSGAITVTATMLPVLMLSAILWVLCEVAERLPEPQRLPQGITSAQMPANMYPTASAPANMQNPTAAPTNMQYPTAAPDIKQ